VRFNWGTGEDYVRLFTDPEQHSSDAVSHDEVFMLHLHGHSYASGIGGSITYLISSLIMLAVFGLIAVGVILAKTASAVMILFVFVVLVIALVDAGGWSRAGRFTKI